jgi:hypothetical protein
MLSSTPHLTSLAGAPRDIVNGARGERFTTAPVKVQSGYISVATGDVLHAWAELLGVQMWGQCYFDDRDDLHFFQSLTSS